MLPVLLGLYCHAPHALIFFNRIYKIICGYADLYEVNNINEKITILSDYIASKRLQMVTRTKGGRGVERERVHWSLSEIGKPAKISIKTEKPELIIAQNRKTAENNDPKR